MPAIRRQPLGETGLEVSTLGLGTASLGQEYGEIEIPACLSAVHGALDAGINLLDTSPYYGRGMSEVLLGIALRGVPRERYVLCTKLGRYDFDKFDFSRQRVIESVDVSLHRLGVEWIDIMLCHDVEFGELDQIVDETLPTLREIQATGKVRAVGISGYPMKIFREVLTRAELDVVLSYANHTLQNRSLTRLLPLLRDKHVGVINAAPFDMRMLTSSEPMDWHPAPEEVRAACREAAALCRRRGTDIAKLAFQFSTRNDAFASTLVGTVYPDEVRRWLRWLDEPIDRDLLAAVEEVLRPVMDRGRTVGRRENN